MQLAEDNRRVAASIFAQMTPGGMIGGYCEDGFPLYFANHEMVRLLGYETFDELAEAIDYQVVNTIHPDDRMRVGKDIGPEYYAGLEYTTTYRMPKKDGTWFWTLDKGRVIEAEDGRLAIVSAKNSDFDFTYISNRFLEIFGYTREQIKELFDDKFINMVHPDDRDKVQRGVNFLTSS